MDIYYQFGGFFSQIICPSPFFIEPTNVVRLIRKKSGPSSAFSGETILSAIPKPNEFSSFIAIRRPQPTIDHIPILPTRHRWVKFSYSWIINE